MNAIHIQNIVICHLSGHTGVFYLKYCFVHYKQPEINFVCSTERGN